MSETRQAFHEELARLETQALGALDMIIAALGRALEALKHQDVELAEIVIADDDRIDGRYLEVHQGILTLLATQAPVATDLRQVMALVRMVAEIERSADLCANICKATRRIWGHDLDPKLRGIISSMGQQARQLYTAAIDAFTASDLAKASAIDDMDSYLDSLQKQFIQAIFESHAAGRIDLQVAVQLAMVARFYERIGDHAVTISQRVQFIITGWLPENKGAERFRNRRDDTAEVALER